jgi:TraM recognition site of TraD and TraG
VRTGSEIAQPAPLDPAPRDPLCYRSRNGTLIRLPNYSPGLASTELCVQGEYQLRARSISPTRSRTRSQVRFQLDICLRGEVVRSQRYETGAASLTEVVELAKVWLRQQRAIARLSFIMAPFSLLLWGLLGATSWFLFPLVSWVSLAPFFVCLTAALASAPARRRRSVTARLAGLSWDRNDFCRGWLITGDTGAGKTFAINSLLHSVFQNEPDWGGLCCDEKGIYHETLVQMTRKYGRLGDLRLLQTKPDGAGDDWEPPAMFNLLSDDSIPGSTYATVIVDTASALAGGGEDKGFFKTQAHAHIGRGIQLFRLLGLRPTMHHLLEALQYQPILRAMLARLDTLAQAGNREARECSDHFLNGYLRQPPEQLGGVISTIYNYLNYFTNPDLVQVFGAEENSFEFSDLDDGAIICIAMPQKYQTERRYITTILKLLFYTHALRRFDPRPSTKRPLSCDNLLICWQDEAQRFVSESDGNVDVIRQANTTTVLAAQSKLSFIPPLGTKEKADVTLLNLRNRIIFKAADRTCAEGSADFIGKKMIWKKSYTRGMGNRSTTRSREEEYRVKPFELMALPKFSAIVKHCEKSFRRARIHPIDPQGKIPGWYPLWKRLLPFK